MRGRAPNTAVVVAGALALWVVLALVFGDLDPLSERGEWLGRRRRGSVASGDRSFTRLWCPPCKAVESHVTTNRFVSGVVGVAQFAFFTVVVAGMLSLARGAFHGPGGRRARDIDEERIRRSVEESARRRQRRGAD